MHASELVEADYTPDNTSPHFQDCPISNATVTSGELQRRFDTVAYPQKGVAFTGTDSDGNAVPAPAVSALD